MIKKKIIFPFVHIIVMETIMLFSRIFFLNKKLIRTAFDLFW